MRQLYKENIYENVGFSKNGAAAYLRGERPLLLVPIDFFKYWEPTEPHHIEVLVGRTYRRPLVMFFKKV